MTPNVSLPMYNLPEMRADNARFWEALRELLVEAGLRDLPERLTFDRLPVPERIGPEVFFLQTCDNPLPLVDYTRLGLRDKGALPSLEVNS